MVQPVFKIAPGIQTYDWGKRGSSSLAAQYALESVPDFILDHSTPYAELWMGTHPALPARVAGDKLLSDLLRQDPALMGNAVAAKFPETAAAGQLPFLFKVLSIGTALSIQAHPNKALAERLHAERPDVYKDANHKPEMAIALTPSRALMNFVPAPTLLWNLLNVPELRGLAPQGVGTLSETLGLVADASDPSLFAVDPAARASDPEKVAVKSVFEAVMRAPEDKRKREISNLITRFKEGDLRGTDPKLAQLAVTLNEQYPGDIGIICVFIMNVVDLDVGQALYLGANVPHAYICGDLIECMAQSDNVVRAGLTPKLRDIPTLVEMLTYDAGPATRQLLHPTEFNRDPATLLYRPSTAEAAEFAVLRVHLAKDEVTTHRPLAGPSLAIVTNGEAVVEWEGYAGNIIVTRGDVLFMAAGIEYKWRARKDTEVFRAFVEA